MAYGDSGLSSNCPSVLDGKEFSMELYLGMEVTSLEPMQVLLPARKQICRGGSLHPTPELDPTQPFF